MIAIDMKLIHAALLLLLFPLRVVQAAPHMDVKPISFTFENDRFVQSDDNYTDGVQLTWESSASATGQLGRLLRSTVCRDLDCLAKPVTVRDNIGQLMYTPHDISDPLAQPQQRPWAGMLYLYRTYTLRVNQNEEMTAGGMVGITGRYSLAEQAQKFIHNHVTGSKDPKGWDNQIGSSLGLMATLEQRKAMWSFQKSNGWRLKSARYWRAGVGNVMTYGALGATIVFSQNHNGLASVGGGIQDKKFSPLGNSGVPSTRFSCLGLAWLACTIDANAEVRFIAYNVFLDGRWGQTDPHVDSKPVVADLSAGVKFSFPEAIVPGRGTPFVRFQLTRRSREYTSSAPSRSQAWGALSFGTEF